VQAIVQCEADARGLLGLDGAIPDLQNLQLTIALQTPASQEKVQKLYQVWQERCPIYLALLKPIPVTTTLEIKGE
jgi:uncharacterized OsmC-like protein